MKRSTPYILCLIILISCFFAEIMHGQETKDEFQKEFERFRNQSDSIFHQFLNENDSIFIDSLGRWDEEYVSNLCIRTVLSCCISNYAELMAADSRSRIYRLHVA